MAKLTVKIASSPKEIDQALKLRYRVFAEGENIAHMKNAAGIEKDEFDDYCDHLIVRDEERDQVVAVYRLLPGSRMGNRRLYTATEFDLSGFAAQIPRALEIGRLCIHPDYRESNAILVLWSGMLAYYGRAEFTYLMGCSSIRTDKLSVVNAVHSYFHDKKYSIDRFRIRPLPHLKIPQLRYVHGVDEKAAFSVLPATIKGYLRLGSEAVSEPIYDPIFRTYDFCMILSKSQVSSRYRRHFLAKAEREAEPASCISGSAA